MSNYKKITYNDYIKILNYYNLPIPNNHLKLKKTAENILATKLCSCIKKVGKTQNETRAIGICTKTIFNRKGFSRGKFKCKNRRTVSLIKNSKKNITIKKR